MTKYCYMDIETTGLHRCKDRITYTGAFLPDKDKVIIIKDPTKKDHQKLLNNIKRSGRKVIWHNGTFDTSFIQCQHDLIFPIDEDSMLMAQVIDSNKTKSLKKIATQELGLPDWDISKKDKLGTGNQEVLEEYLEGDLRNGWKVFKYKKYQLDNSTPGQQNIYRKILIPAASAIRQMQSNGVYIDLEGMKEQKRLYEIELEEILETLEDVLPDQFKHLTKTDGKSKSVGLNSSKKLADLFDYLEFPILLKTPKGARSTSSEAINMLAKEVDHPILQLIIEYRNITKNLVFLNKWLESQYNSRLYPSFNLAGTKTGRLSSSEPNLQQVPRNPRLRNLFTAPKGHHFVEADFSQVELRIAAHITNDPAMIKAYNSGEDLHTATAKIFNDEPSKEDRTKAKSMNFGLLYGMQASTYRDYADNNYGLELTEKEATALRNDFFDKYKQLPKYHKAIERKVLASGKLYNEFGRVRKFPDVFGYNKYKRSAAVRQSINFPVQSLASDILVGCIIEIHKRYPDIKLVGTVHDSILLEIETEEQRQAVETLMNNPKILRMFKVKLKVPLESDVACGPWGTH